MLSYLKKFFAEAKNKLSTYVAMLIASAGEIRENWSDVVSNLPHWHWLDYAEKHMWVALGFLVVYARVRRALKEAGNANTPA